MDNRGSSTIEIAVILIIILMIFGVIMSSIEKTENKITKTQETNNMEKLISEVVDNLINNPGSPNNWEEYGKGTPGLAIINDGGEVIANSISYQKFIALGKDYSKFVDKGLFNSKIKSSMELKPQESTIASVKIGSSDEGKEIFSMNRLVKCNFYKNYVICDFNNQGKCNHNHKQDTCSCQYFKVFPGNVKKSDYYLLIDDYEKDNLKYIVDTTRVVKERYWQQATSNVIYLNDKFDFYEDNSAVVFVHLDNPKPNAVIISVPKTFDKNNIEYDFFKTTNCEFTFKAWY